MTYIASFMSVRIFCSKHPTGLPQLMIHLKLHIYRWLKPFMSDRQHNIYCTSKVFYKHCLKIKKCYYPYGRSIQRILRVRGFNWEILYNFYKTKKGKLSFFPARVWFHLACAIILMIYSYYVYIIYIRNYGYPLTILNCCNIRVTGQQEIIKSNQQATIQAYQKSS